MICRQPKRKFRKPEFSSATLLYPVYIEIMTKCIYRMAPISKVLLLCVFMQRELRYRKPVVIKIKKNSVFCYVNKMLYFWIEYGQHRSLIILKRKIL